MENKNKVGRPKSKIEYVKTSIRLPKHIDAKIVGEISRLTKSKAEYMQDIIITETAKIKQ